MEYEIVVFEDSDIWYGDTDVSPDKIICEFIECYIRYFNPCDLEEKDVWFQSGKSWLTYRDKSGNDKPITIMLVGPITKEIKELLKEEVSKVYMRSCWECKKKFKHKTWAMCEECRYED
jgi:hypothetical protein